MVSAPPRNVSSGKEDEPHIVTDAGRNTFAGITTGGMTARRRKAGKGAIVARFWRKTKSVEGINEMLRRGFHARLPSAGQVRVFVPVLQRGQGSPPVLFPAARSTLDLCHSINHAWRRSPGPQLAGWKHPCAAEECSLAGSEQRHGGVGLARGLSSGRRADDADVAAILEAASRGEFRDLSRVTAARLRGLLRILGQKTSGNKPQLVARISQMSDATLREACNQVAGLGEVGRKDLLTGTELAQRDKMISRANDAFYDAYEDGNIKAMEEVWGTDAHVKCSHPGRRFANGHDEVMKSWRDLFQLQELHYRGKIHVSEIRINSADNVAWVTCTETWDQGQGEEILRVAVLNIFRLQPVRNKHGQNERLSSTGWLLECRVASRLVPELHQ